MKNSISKSSIQASELRTGNQLYYRAPDGEGSGLCKVDWQDIKWCEEDPVDFNKHHRPLLLTESLMVKVRCQYLEDASRIEFSTSEPGERQIEKNYWSNEVVSDRRLHLSPSYDYKMGSETRVRDGGPKFWFIWICAYGTGSGWFLNIRDCHHRPLRFFHELQNIYFSLSGSELLLRNDFEFLQEELDNYNRI